MLRVRVDQYKRWLLRQIEAVSKPPVNV
jgi:hypothetical protein